MFIKSTSIYSFAISVPYVYHSEELANLAVASLSICHFMYVASLALVILTIADMSHQTALNFPTVASSTPIPPVVPLSLSQAFTTEAIVGKWEPRPPATGPSTFPSTHAWTNDELVFFNLHYVPVATANVPMYFCPLTALTPGALEIATMDISLDGFLRSMHFILLLD